MTPKDFQKFKAEFMADATTLAKVMRAFSDKWRKRESEARSLTPEQDKEMESVGEIIDNALERIL